MLKLKSIKLLLLWEKLLVTCAVKTRHFRAPFPLPALKKKFEKQEMGGSGEGIVETIETICTYVNMWICLRQNPLGIEPGIPVYLSDALTTGTTTPIEECELALMWKLS